MGYLYLALAIILEFLGTTCMKLSNGFAHLMYSLGTLIFYGLCFYFLSLTLKTLPLNITYATWGALGIVLASLVSYFYFHESISLLSLLGIVFIIIGVLLCNLFGAEH